MTIGLSPPLATLLLPLGQGGFLPALPWLVPLLLISEGAALVWVIYNNLVTARNECDRAWGNIDVLLRQRADELPNLVAVCSAYMTHEREALAAVTEARRLAVTADGPAAADAAGRGVHEALGRLFAMVETYPGLKADAQFIELQRRITGLESEIADRREFFNSAVTNYNTRIARLPDALVAGWFGFRRRPLLRWAGLDRTRVVNVSHSAA